MFCLPIEQVVPWLFTINSNKVKKGEVRDNLLRFQIHLGKELDRVARGLISSSETAELKAMVVTLMKQMETLSTQLGTVQAELSEVRTELKEVKAENILLRQTNEAVWKARSHEASSASYGMHAAKARKSIV